MHGHPRLVGVLHVGPEVLTAQPRHARPEDVGDQRVLLEQRARVHARAARYRADRHAVQVAVGHVLRDHPVRRREAGQDSRHRAGERLAAVRAEPAPHRPVDGAQPRRRDVADFAALRRDAHKRGPAVRADGRRRRLAALVRVLCGDEPAPMPLVARSRASLPQPRGLVRVLPEVDLRRRRVLPERRLPRVAHLGPQARLEVRDAGLEADDLVLLRGDLPQRLHVLGAEASRGLALSPHPPPRAATRSGARPPPRGGPRAAFRFRPPCASSPRRGRARAGICPCRRHGR